MTIHAVVNPNGLTIVSQGALRSLRRKNLSATAVSGLSGCQASWGFKIFSKWFLEYPLDMPFRRGLMFHYVMEHLAQSDPQFRSAARARALVDEVAQHKDYKDLYAIPEAQQWLKTAVNNVYTMGLHPMGWRMSNRLAEFGAEVKVEGSLYGSTNSFMGYIDLLLEGNNGVVIVDWKTGSAKPAWKPGNLFDSGLDEARQQFIYAKLLTQDGIDVTGAQLWYPLAKEIVSVSLNLPALASRVEDDVKQADWELSNRKEDASFSFTPSALCSWCPLVNACPSARPAKKQKEFDAREKNPTKEEILQGVEIES